MTSRRSRTRPAALALVGVAAAIAVGGSAQASPAHTAEEVPTAALVRSDVDAWLDDTLPGALEESQIAGATVAVVHDGEILTTRGFGVADVEAGTPVDPDRSLFRAGSVSKVFTATAVMQLVERGEVDLDTDVEQYTGLDLGTEQPVTLRHLLTHTPGFEERITGLIGTTTPDLRDSLVTDPPEQVFEPGTTPAYSNYGNALAGYVVEAVSGMPFEEYVARHVLEPAGMTSSSFAQPLPDHLAADVALGYPTSADAPVPFEIIGQPPAGALSATATDMARFMLAQLGHPTNGQELLSPATRTRMMEPALDAESLGILADGPRMGLGWFDESRHGHRVVGHGGDTMAFHSHLQLWPNHGTGLFLSLSSTGTDGAAYLLRDQLLDQFADRYYPGPATTASTVPDDVRAEHAQALAGAYESTRGFHSTFLTTMGVLEPTSAEVVDGDRVRFIPGPGQLEAAEYTEIEPWVYQQVGGHRVLTVRTDDAGRVELIGHDSAMSMVPIGTVRGASIPALVAGGAVLLLATIVWPVGAVVQRLRGRRRTGVAGIGATVPGPREAAGAPSPVALPSRLTRVAAAVTVVALAGWAYVVLSVLSFQPVPELLIRAVQVATAVGVLGLFAAGWRLVAEVRARGGWLRIGAASVLLLAFAVTSVAVNELLLLAPDITY